MAFWSVLTTPAPRTPLASRPSRTLFSLLVGAFLLSLVPHVEQLPLWLTGSVVISIVVRCVLEIHRLPLPSSAFCALIALCLLTGISIQYHTVVGRDAGTAFTAGLLAIKFFELRGPRDVALIIFSCFFVVMSSLLYSQVVELFIYCLIMMWVLTALLLRTQMGDKTDDHLIGMLGHSGLIFLQALPFALFLFFFFPRYQGKLQLTLNSAAIGLTSEVRPGSIASMAEDDSEAMYVQFVSGDVPTIDTMYWRAMVLWHYENATGEWSEGDLSGMPEQLPIAMSHSNQVVQRITVWPHFRKWLFALDYPIQPPENSSEMADWATTRPGGILRLYGQRNLEHKERYTVTSSLQLVPHALNETERNVGLQLSEKEIDPQVRALAARLRHESTDDQSYIFAVLHYFRHEHFVYSVTPGAEPKGQEKKWLADFLFVRKTGFCEHFASAFAVLMRLANIPARLVVGYQGGEYNPYDNSYMVRQSNAHAWTEVWSESKSQWVRYDPTAILSQAESNPLANNGAGSDGASETLSLHATQHGFFSKSSLPPWLRSTLQDMQMRRDQIEANWDDLVFSYDPEAQSRLADALGLGSKNPTALGIACFLAFCVCVFIFRKWVRRRKDVSPVEELYAQFCRTMAQRGILRALWEGPLAYTHRVAEAFPEKGEAIHDLGSIVAHSRYGRSPIDPATPRDLKDLLTSITSSRET
jgi:hypothetical protein